MSLLLRLRTTTEPEIPPAVVVQTFSGGFFDLPIRSRRVRDEIRKQLEEEKALPPQAEEIILEAVVEKVSSPQIKVNLAEAFEEAEVAYLQKYEEIYLRLVAKKRRDEEDEFLLLH